MHADAIELLAGALRARAGFDLNGHRRDDLLRAVRALQPIYGDAETMLAGLERSDALFDDLVRALTIGETTFFRHPEQFSLLTSRILPPLIAQRREAGTLRLNLWSAACATGEEPYSIALALLQLLPDFEAWDITIRGSDINPDFLAAARDAAYAEWSFRGCAAWVRDWFRRSGKRSRLDERVRRLVTFERFNLVRDEYPRDVDVIFCRNVMIYFDAETRARVLASLRDALSPEGWLLVGHADLGVAGIEGLEAHFAAESFVYRRSGERPQSCRPRPAAPQRRQRGTPAPASRKPPTPLETAFSLFDRGDDEGAAETLRRALYLDPRQPAAHYLAGTVAARRGNARLASRHFRAALVTLSTMQDTAVVHGTEDITVQRLRQTIDALLRELTEDTVHV